MITMNGIFCPRQHFVSSLCGRRRGRRRTYVPVQYSYRKTSHPAKTSRNMKADGDNTTVCAMPLDGWWKEEGGFGTTKKRLRHTGTSVTQERFIVTEKTRVG